MKNNRPGTIIVTTLLTVIILLIIAISYVYVRQGASLRPNLQDQDEEQQNSGRPAETFPEALENATLSYPNPYNASENDIINLINGQATIAASANTGPSNYTLATTTIGDLNGDNVPEGAIALYQAYGANIIRPVIFVFSDEDGILHQIDATLPLPGTIDDEIESLSIHHGILSISLLTVSDHDMQTLPHYEWKPTIEKQFSTSW